MGQRQNFASGLISGVPALSGGQPGSPVSCEGSWRIWESFLEEVGFELGLEDWEEFQQEELGTGRVIIQE